MTICTTSQSVSALPGNGVHQDLVADTSEDSHVDGRGPVTITWEKYFGYNTKATVK